MKRAAFIQAVTILALLSVSWILIIKKFSSNNGDKLADDASSPEIQVTENQQGSADPAANQILRNVEISEVPEDWDEWITYIQNQPDAENRRLAIEELRQALFGLDNKEALERMLSFLKSEFDFSTGLAFQASRGGALVAATSFRAMLLDWLGQLDPASAAEIALTELNRSGTELHPDVYVIHMRNYAWGTPQQVHSAFLAGQMKVLLDNQQWISRPTASIGEAMDVAVYLQDTGLVPALTGIAQPGVNENLRHAANLALERLFEIDPFSAADELLNTDSIFAMDGRNRASLMSRLDPVNADNRQLLEDYLLSPYVNAEEFELFIQYLPNLNISYSFNLLSPENPITQSISHSDRLQHALDTIELWRDDQRFNRYTQILGDRVETLNVQLYGNPSP